MRTIHFPSVNLWRTLSLGVPPFEACFARFVGRGFAPEWDEAMLGIGDIVLGSKPDRCRFSRHRCARRLRAVLTGI